MSHIRRASCGRRRLDCVARVLLYPPSMKRILTASIVVLVTSLFVGSAFKAQAATKASPAAAVVQSTAEGSTSGGYWAAWSDAASH